MLLRWTFLFSTVRKVWGYMNGILVPLDEATSVFNGFYLVVEGTFPQFVACLRCRPALISKIVGFPISPCTIVNASALITSFQSNDPYELFKNQGLRLSTNDDPFDEDGHPQMRRLSKNFELPEGVPTIFGGDIDKVDFDKVPAHMEFLSNPSPKEINDVVCSYLPELQGASWYTQPSSSSGICAPNGGQLKGYQSYRIFYPVNDASKVITLGKNLYNRSYKHYGHIEVADGGNRNPRSLVDNTYYQTGRLDFLADPLLKDGLTRYIPQELFPSYLEGNVADISKVTLCAKSAGEQYALERKQKNNQATLDLSESKVEKCIEKAVTEYITSTPNVTDEQVEKQRVVLKKFHSDKGKIVMLPANYTLCFAPVTKISAMELVANWDQYVGKSICSPKAPWDYNWGKKAQLYWYYPDPINHPDLREPSILDFAHGDKRRYLFPLSEYEEHWSEDNCLNPLYHSFISEFLHRLLPKENTPECYFLYNTTMALGTHIKVCFENDIWEFDSDKLVITGDEIAPKKEHKTIARRWRDLVVQFRATHMDFHTHALEQFNPEALEFPTGDTTEIESFANNFKRGDTKLLIASTGAGKTYVISGAIFVKHLISRATAYLQCQRDDVPWNPLESEQPVFVLPTAANVENVSVYVMRHLRQMDIAPEVLELLAPNGILHPLFVPRLLSKNRDILGESVEDRVTTISNAFGVITTYAYLNTRAFLALAYPLCKAIVRNLNCLMLCDEIQYLAASTLKVFFQDLNFSEHLTQDVEDEDGDPNSSSDDAGDVDGGDSGRYSEGCAQYAITRKGHAPKAGVCNKLCRLYADHGSWIYTSYHPKAQSANVLLPSLVPEPPNPKNEAKGRAYALRLTYGREINVPWADIKEVSKVERLNSVGILMPVYPHAFNTIIERKIERKLVQTSNEGREERLSFYKDDLTRYIARLHHLQEQTFYPVLRTYDNATGEELSASRMSRQDVADWIDFKAAADQGIASGPSGSVNFLAVGCGLRILKGEDSFAYDVLQYASSVLLMTATCSQELELHLKDYFPKLEIVRCEGNPTKLDKIIVMVTNRTLGLKDLVRIKEFDTLMGTMRTSRPDCSLLLCQAFKSQLYLVRKNIEDFTEVSVISGDEGTCHASIEPKSFNFKVSYAGAPEMTGQNHPSLVSLFDQGAYRPKMAAFIPTTHPIWDARLNNWSTQKIEAELNALLEAPHQEQRAQNTGRVARLRQCYDGSIHPGESKVRLIVLFNAPTERLPNKTHRYLPLPKMMLDSLQERAHKFELIEVPIGIQVGPKIIPLFERFITDPTIDPTIADSRRNTKFRIKASPQERFEAEVIKLVGQGMTQAQIIRKKTLIPSQYKGREALLEERLVFVKTQFPND